jgi:hypothetical protein
MIGLMHVMYTWSLMTGERLLWSLMTGERLLWYPRKGHNSKILDNVLLTFICSFQRSSRLEIIPHFP